MLKIELQKRKKQLEEYISRIEPWLKGIPDKALSVSTRKRNGKTSYRYFIFKERRELSSKTDLPLIKALIRKNYYQKVLAAAQKEMTLINALLNATDEISNIYPDLHEARKRMLKGPLEISVKTLVRKFLEEKYPPSEYEIKNPNDTLKGDIVRSWPEVSIANALFKANIPYRYERPFTLYNGHTIRPDFTIMHPVSGEIFIWEHFGRMDKPSYEETSIRKIKDYAQSNMVLGKNLITTFENEEYKLTEKEVLQIIDLFFKS